MSLNWCDTLDAVDWQALSDLYRVAPLGDKPPELLRTVFGHSMFTCLVYDREHLVGAGRALADGADCAYFCDIAVHPDHQGTGLGQQIVRHLLDKAKGHRKIILYAVPGKEPFYRRFGFLRMKTAMAIFQQPQQQIERGYLSED